MGNTQSGNNQNFGTILKQGIKLFKKLKRAKRQYDRQQQQQQHQQHQQQSGGSGGGYQQQHQQQYNNNQQQQQQQRPPNHSSSPAYHQIQQEHDDPEYSKLRAMAHDEAEKRNACYQRSQEAYHDGNGALAKEESNKGHRHDEQMKQYNRKAADLVYAQKNQGRPPTEIDLHGLFVQEASERVDQALRRCEKENYDHLVIIVGKGLHSPGQVAKLKPAIINLVKKYKVQCTPNKPNPGCLYIEFGKGTGDLDWLDRFTDKLSRNEVCAIM
ncbi:hypothetical protein BCR42DRAFT_417214 [Absidia repens]|uniref:Smr domain-containing protein n=1 Tax=Absidia repens TaxID=90262 RepID=A0A1X2IDM6_9FUNG|nr:hypothetical protein BCR42DRAFT_417214 [Absidia repens]